jgi:hypothetical protein
MDLQTFTPARRRAAVAGAAVLVAAIAAAFFVMSRGSGSASASAGPAGGPPAMARPQRGGAPLSDSAFRQFEECMAKNGVTLTPGQRPDVADATVRKALMACRSYLPARPGGRDDDQGPRGFGPNGQPVAPGGTT